MEQRIIKNGDIELQVRVAGEGPLIVCVHGFPELGYSWRHQISYFSARGFQVAALDMRGYGGSSKPVEIAAYSLKNLAGDVAAVATALAEGRPSILFGHDWGAPTAWTTALLYPDKFRAVALLSVPFGVHGELSLLGMLRPHYQDRFFYQEYFQAEGVAEAEIEADLPSAMRKIYFALSGDVAPGKWLEPRPKDADLLSDMEDPDPFPAWMSPSDLDVYLKAFRQGGLRAPINRYRAQEIDITELVSIRDQRLAQPSYFIGGERDPVRNFFPGLDLYAQPGNSCDDFRGSLIMPNIGHWVQQEAPLETNEALPAFIRQL